jgi:hypothetical protein
MKPYLTFRRKAVWGSRVTFAALAIALIGVVPSASATTRHGAPTLTERRHVRTPETRKPGVPGTHLKVRKLDAEMERRAVRSNPNEKSKVIVLLQPGAKMPEEFKKYMRGSKLGLINGQPLELPNRVIRQLEKHPNFFRVVEDRPIATHNYRTSVTVGARTVQESLGYTGAGIGIAVIDSGIATWHDDLNQGQQCEGLSVRQPARHDVRGLRERPDAAVRRQRARQSRVRHHPRQRLRLVWREVGDRAESLAHLAEGPRRERPGHDQQHHCGAGLGRGERPDLQHSRREHVGRRVDS